MKKLCDCTTAGTGHECCDALKTAGPDYEAMYNKLLEEHEALCAKYNAMDQDRVAMRAEYARMRAQLDIVYLIFGKK